MKIYLNSNYILIALCLFFMCEGCAVVNSTIRPSHELLMSSRRTLASRDIYLSINDANCLTRQGAKKNGYGWETANIYTSPKPGDIINNVMSSELRSVGFNVYSNSLLVNKYPFLEIELNQFFTEPEVGFWAGDVYTAIDTNLRFKMDQSTAYERRIKGMGKVTTIVWSDHFYKESMEKALNDYVRKAIPAVIEIINNFR